MSQKDFDAALNRLTQAVEDIQWALSVLDDPSSNLKEYDLTADEKTELLQKYHALLAEIHVLQAQTLLKRVNIQVKNKRVEAVGPIPPWIDISEADILAETVSSVSPHPNHTSGLTTAVGPIPPYSTPTPGVETAIPPIPAYDSTTGAGEQSGTGNQTTSNSSNS